MIRRLDSLSDLAIVGLSVNLPSGGDINEFARRVYRGLPMTDQFSDETSLDFACVEATRQACEMARLPIEQVRIISMSPSAARILEGNGSGTRIINISGVTLALIEAADQLESSGAEAVLLIECQEDLSLVCAVLISQYKTALDNAKPIQALVAGAAQAEGPLHAANIPSVIQEARRASSIGVEGPGLVLSATFMDGMISDEEMAGLLGATVARESLSCALARSLPGLAGIVETVLCLSRRVIPGIKGWSGPVDAKTWDRSPFYVETESRSWFVPDNQNRRVAGLNLVAVNGTFTHLLFCDLPAMSQQCSEAPQLEDLKLFPIAGSSPRELLEKMTALEANLIPGTKLADSARDAYQQYLLEAPSTINAACLLGSSREDLLREIGFASKGIPDSYEKLSDWKTPLGSFFTPHPLGQEGEVSFVYPGAFNSYPGIGRDLFYLFPNLYTQISGISKDIGGLLNEGLLYPRSLTPLTPDDLSAIEEQLSADPITMLISGSSLAFLYTEVLRNVFEIHPASAFGYSLGEVSMLFASRVWTEADGTSQALRESPLFRTRLSGPQNAVREYWKLPGLGENDPAEPIWGNYLLMTGPEKVKEALPQEPRVYLTHINTPRQVVIGGDPAGCQRVIGKLKCKSIQAPFNYAIHCEPIQSENEKLTELHSVPVSNQPGMRLYSAATFQPMPIDRQVIARQIAQELSHCLDFPRLIQAAYKDGARIFIELGAGSNCARWVNETLEGQAHAAYSINRKGVDDHTSILRLMARMVSHRVPVNIKVLYQG